MTTINRIPSNLTHARVYVGAPYGDGEGGHIVTLHRSARAAEDACYPLDNCIVVTLDAPYRRAGVRCTAREYFEA